MVEVTVQKQDEKQDLESIEQLMLTALQTIKKRLHEDAEPFQDEINATIADWKIHADKLISDNKELQSSLERSKNSLLDKTVELNQLKQFSEELKNKYHALLDKEHDETGLKKKLNEAEEKNNDLNARISELKQLLLGQRESIQEHKKVILQRDELITTANEQLAVLAEEKNIVNMANEQLFLKINQMKRVIDKLNDDLALKDDEIKNIRALLTSEKNNEKQRIKQKLMIVAKSETKKDVLMNARIRELMDVIAKQRDVINEFAVTDTELAENFKAIIEDTQKKRASINYSIVKKEFEELTLDNASISRLVEEIGSETNTSSSSQREDELLNEPSSLADQIRQGLQNGDPPTLIKQSLITSGKDEAEVTKALEEEATKLNIKL